MKQIQFNDPLASAKVQPRKKCNNYKANQSKNKIVFYPCLSIVLLV